MGGAEMMLLKLLERLDHRFRPEVISLSDMGEIGPRIVALGVPVVAMGMRRGIPDPRGIWRLYRRLRNSRPDVVQTWMYHADLLGGVATKMAGKAKVVWSIRNGTLDANHSRLTTQLTVRACARLSSLLPDRIVSCSATAWQIHEALGYDAKRMLVIPNGFDLERFRPDATARDVIRSALGIPAEALLVGMMGRFDPQKNHVGFVEASLEVHRRLPGVHFVLAGTGVDASNRDLVHAIDTRGLASVVHLLGVRQDMPQLMAALDVLASSAIYGEAFPNVIGEAMACGVPCVVTDVGDSAAIVGETGRVVNPGDVQGLSNALIELLSLSREARHALGAGARERIANNYEIGKVTTSYEALYAELLKEAAIA